MWAITLALALTGVQDAGAWAHTRAAAERIPSIAEDMIPPA